MAKAIITESYLEDIADSIRAKLGVQTTYLPSEMSAAIDSISGGGVTVEPLSVTANGTYTAPTGKAYTPVTVNVAGGGGSISALLDEEIKQDSGSTKTLDETVTIPEDGNYYVFAIGYDSATDVYINSVQQTNDYDYSTDYIHAYAKKVTLSKDDTVRINMYGSGHVYIRAFIAKEGGGTGAPISIDFTALGTYTVNNISFSSAGASFDSASDYISIPWVHSDCTIEIDVDHIVKFGTAHNRFAMADSSNGFIYRSSGVWAFYSSTWEDTQETDAGFFDGSTVKIYIDSSNHWHIYKDNVLFFEPSAARAISSFTIGASSNSIGNALITGVRVYAGEK